MKRRTARDSMRNERRSGNQNDWITLKKEAALGKSCLLETMSVVILLPVELLVFLPLVRLRFLIHMDIRNRVDRTMI